MNIAEILMKYVMILIFFIACINSTIFKKDDGYCREVSREIVSDAIQEKYFFIFSEFCSRNGVSLLLFKGKDTSFCLPILDYYGSSNVQIWTDEIISLMHSHENKYKDLLFQNLVEILLKHDLFVYSGLLKIEKLKEYISEWQKWASRQGKLPFLQNDVHFSFISEYTAKVDGLISKSKKGIYFIRHFLTKKTMELSVKSLFGISEGLEPIASINIENEMENHLFNPMQYLLLIFSKTEVNNSEEAAVEIFNSLSPILVSSLHKVIGNVINAIFYFFGIKNPENTQPSTKETKKDVSDGCFPPNIKFAVILNYSNFFEALRCVLINHFKEICNSLRESEAQISKTYKNSENTKEDPCEFHNETTASLNISADETDHRFSQLKNRNIEFHLSRLIEILPEKIISSFFRIIFEIQNNFTETDSDETYNEKNEHAVKQIWQRIYNELLSNREDTLLFISKLVSYLLSFAKQDNWVYLDEFSSVFSKFLNSNWYFYKYLIDNPKLLIMILIKIAYQLDSSCIP